MLQNHAFNQGGALLAGHPDTGYRFENFHLFQEDKTSLSSESLGALTAEWEECDQSASESDGRSTETTSCPSDCYNPGETQEQRKRHACVSHREFLLCTI